MKEIENSKMIYDNIEIPSELNQVVRNAIAAAEEKRKKENIVSFSESNREEDKSVLKKKSKKNTSKKWSTFLRRGATMAAALTIAFTVGLNSNEAFAMEMEAHPILGGLAKILTIRSYHGFDEEKGIQKDLEIPAIEIQETEEEIDIISTVNLDIQTIIDSHVDEAEDDFEEYKKIFMENDGTMEEWAGRTMELDVNYEVKYQDENLVSLVVFYSEVSASAYEKAYYYNINLKENRDITLKDLLGDEYVSIANDQILSQMKERMEEDENLHYWGIGGEEEDGITGFISVDESTTFYINEAGNPVITFEEYEVAPGFMGIQEFEIKKI